MTTYYNPDARPPGYEGIPESTRPTNTEAFLQLVLSRPEAEVRPDHDLQGVAAVGGTAIEGAAGVVTPEADTEVTKPILRVEDDDLSDASYLTPVYTSRPDAPANTSSRQSTW